MALRQEHVDSALSGQMRHVPKYRKLIQWLIDGGANFDRLFLKEYSGGNRGVHIMDEQKISKGDEVVEIPLKFLITGSLAMCSEIGNEISGFIMKF